jgi:Zn-dependent peptidase ImmA (M78 family)
MTTRGPYDPYEHADRLGIPVIHGRLRSDNGMWIPAERVIILRRGMRRLLERSTLAHELGHAALGHQDDRPRHERQADIFAARHLIDPRQLASVARDHPDPGYWCTELDVTPHILETYLREVRRTA